MKTLEEHNKERQILYNEIQQLNQPHPNGIACPKCGEELWDNDNMILTSIPPKKIIHCPKCGYSGYRLA